MSNSNGRKISAHVDVYHTLVDLLTYPSHYHPKPWKAAQNRRDLRRGNDATMVTPISLLERYLVVPVPPGGPASLPCVPSGSAPVSSGKARRGNWRV